MYLPSLDTCVGRQIQVSISGWDSIARPELRNIASMIRDPPVGGIAGILVLDEVHAGKIRTLEHFLVPEGIILAQLRAGCGAAYHGLKNQPGSYFLDDRIQGIQ